MTTERDFDRIARAWLDTGPNEAPDRAIAAILDAVETTAQTRRPWRWPIWRPTTMTRIAMLAVLAGTIAILIGALALTGGSPAPAPTAAPVAEPSTAAASAQAITPLPAAVKGGWVAPSRGNTLVETEVATIVLGVKGVNGLPADFFIDRPGCCTPILGSAVDPVGPDVLRFTLDSAFGRCATGAVGDYRWTVTPDGQWLTLALVDDACDTRSAFLAGTWQHSLAHDNQGGSGIAANFHPYVAFSLPAETWKGNGFGETDTLVLDNGGGTADLRFWKDPDGFNQACDRDAGRLDLEPGIDPFVAYLRDSPQFTVIKETELTVDGHRAVEVEIRLGDNIDQPCAPMDGNEANPVGILLWASHGADGAFWNGTFGDQWSLVVTEVDGATIVMEIARQEGTTYPVDRSVVDSIRFFSELPTPPAS